MRKNRTLALVLSLCLPGVLGATNGAANDEAPLTNWSAPPYWQASAVAASADSGPHVATKSEEVVTAGSGAPAPFVALSPCRLADTRAGSGFAGPYGPPSLTPNVQRDFPVAGQCGVPVDAVAVSFNFTVVRPQGLGLL